MLEYKFNSLDDDFITLWSNYILYNDTTLIIKPLEKLAEKGQINAIQSWYLLKKPEQQNATIDAIVENFYGHSFNEALAIAHKTYARTKADLDELTDKILEQENLVLKYADIHPNSYCSEISYFNELKYVIDKYKQTEFADKIRDAAKIASQTAQDTKSCLVFERLYEICAASPLIFSDVEICKDDIRNVRRSLLNRLKLNPNDAVAKFAYAKNLSFFPLKDKNKLEGAKILEELAARPLKTVEYEIEQE